MALTAFGHCAEELGNKYTCLLKSSILIPIDIEKDYKKKKINKNSQNNKTKKR